MPSIRQRWSFHWPPLCPLDGRRSSICSHWASDKRYVGEMAVMVSLLVPEGDATLPFAANVVPIRQTRPRAPARKPKGAPRKTRRLWEAFTAHLRYVGRQYPARTFL